MSRLALVVGINEYPAPNRLSYCVRDAEAIASALEKDAYGYAVTRLYDEEATRHGVLRALHELRAADPVSLAFFFAGHGVATEVGSYLVTVDADEADPGIDLPSLSTLVSAAEADTRCLLLLDCCHAGAAVNWRGFRRLETVDIRTAFPAPGLNRAILAACRADESAREDPDLGHGIFSYHLLQGLDGAAANSFGEVTAAGLYEYASRAFDESPSQRPVFRGDQQGRLVVGEGFPAINQLRSSEESLRSVEEQAHVHLDDYTLRLHTLQRDHDGWKASGWREASQMLEPIARWYDSQRLQLPELSQRPRFRELSATLVGRIAQLANATEGTVTRFGTLLEVKGAGAFGSVWHVQGNERDFAYKIYLPTELNNKVKLSRFARGYSAMRRLDHPHIVRVHDFTEAPVGFTMDYVAGPNLRQLGNVFDADPAALVALFLTVVQTVAHSHARNVLHRDIKPENILALYRDPVGWTPYLTDFDLAWFSTATQLTRDAMGVIFYAAPEQLARPDSGSAREQTVDIYSLGQLLYFLVTGSDPLPAGYGDNAQRLSERTAQWPVGRTAELIGELYQRSTEPNPRRRFQDCGEILEILGQVEDDLRSAESGLALSRDRFIHEAAFAVAPLGGGPDTTGRFASTSGETAVEISFVQSDSRELVTASIILSRTASSAIGGGDSYEGARARLIRRIDAALRDHPGVVRRNLHGRVEPFRCRVEVSELELNMDGVARVRAVVSAAIRVIEGG